jgi:maleate isomerase
MKDLRLGLIVPSSNTTMEAEYGRVLPDNITLHTGRMRLRDVTVEALVEMERSVEEEALKLADADIDIIGYGCTSGSLVKGLHHDKEIVSKIETVTNVPAVATAGAVVDALKSFKINKVAVATPYIDEINNLEKKFLNGNGFEVVEIKGLSIVENTKIGVTKGEVVIDLIKSLNHRDADSVFISCTNLPTMNIIEKLERMLHKPVISSNTATLWSMIKRSGHEVKIEGIGQLFS